MSHEDKITNAEMIWTLKVAASGFSFAAVKNSKKFQEMK